MSDLAARRLDRAAQSGDLEAEAARLHQRRRNGEVTHHQMRVAAYCGHEPARVALGWQPSPFKPEHPVHRMGSAFRHPAGNGRGNGNGTIIHEVFERWWDNLDILEYTSQAVIIPKPRVTIRGLVAACEWAYPGWVERMGTSTIAYGHQPGESNEEALMRAWCEMVDPPSRAIAMLRNWVDDPTEAHEHAVTTLLDSMPWSYGLWSDLVSVVKYPKSSKVMMARLTERFSVLSIRRVVEESLIKWAVGE